MRLADFLFHGALGLGIERRIQGRAHDDLGIKSFNTFASDTTADLPGGTDSGQRQSLFQGHVGDRLVLLPGRPSALFPTDGVAETSCIPWVVLQIGGQRCRLIRRQHLVGDDGAFPSFNQGGNDLGL